MSTSETNTWIAQVADDKEALSMAESELKSLTPEGLLSLYRLIQKMEDQTKVPEAQGSASTYMRGPGGAEVLVVARGVCLEAAWKDLEQFVIERIKQNYQPVIKYPERGHNGGTAAATKPADAAAQSGAPASTAGGEIKIVKMEVIPREGGRADVDFYAENHKWPDLKVQNWTNDSILKLLLETGNWDEDDLRVRKAWTVSMIGVWKPSEKLNSRGEPYKNVVALKPAD